MGKGDAADPADVKGAAKLEGEYGRKAARDETYANRPDQNNAFGSITWGQEQVFDPVTGEPTTKWTQNENMSPEMRRNFDAEMGRANRNNDLSSGMGDRIAQEMGTPMDWDQFGDYQSGPESAGVVGGSIYGEGENQGGQLDQTTDADNNFEWSSENRGRAEDDAYGRSTQRMDPRFEKDQKALETRLRNRGLSAGDQQYQSEMDSFNTGRNDAYEMARMGATGEGRAEDRQSYDQARGGYDANLANDQQAYNQQYGQNRNLREADQQRYDQDMRSGENNRAADKQAWDQESQQSERANALRDKQMAETIGKRQFSLKEQQALAPDVKGITDTYSSGG